MPRKILTISTNVAYFSNGLTRTGLWLGELAHFVDVLYAEGFNVDIASPLGGVIPIDPVSISHFNFDKVSSKYYYDDDFVNLLNNSMSLGDVDPEKYVGVYLAGGHGAIYDFPNNIDMHRIVNALYEKNNIVSAACHGCAGLINVYLSSGKNILDGHLVTGYSWNEEVLAMRGRLVEDFNLEREIIRRNAKYSKALLPFYSHVVSDGVLVTGQNPRSALGVAKEVVKLLRK